MYPLISQDVVEAQSTVLGPVRIEWVPSARRVTMRFIASDRLTGDVASELRRIIADWVGDEGRLGLVVDCAGVGPTDASWRATWFEYLRGERERVALTWCNVGPAIGVVVTMFATAMRALGSFDCSVQPSRERSRAWLVERGYCAR